ncbi:MAG: GNAT family N-acetyltransferase [Arcobacter sp.]|uniref:GNAT family N-acetyltransferase n=1 Tax=Arcobacter sp. TaxID=1872629 RepID=UPI003AFF93F0
MQLKIAQIEDIDNILKLHAKYQLATIAEVDKKDGFVTTGFSKEELTSLIKEEQGLFIAIEEDKVLGYVMSASWQFWSKWPMFAHMIKDLPKLNYLGQTLTVDNSYQYGPVCIDKSVRGSGLLEKLFDFALDSMSKRYPILVTFVNKINERSYAAHKRKLELDVIQEFEFNNNKYYEMVFDISKRVLDK